MIRRCRHSAITSSARWASRSFSIACGRRLLANSAVLDCLRQEAVGQFGRGTSAKRAKSELFLTLNSMPLAVSLRGEIFVYRFRENADLFGDKCQQGNRGPLTGA